ncbi:hypothetical protein NLI96_g2869 [Meripilus lineatus]|uniref:Alpha/beta hydrolase fold-3 domain-containing protein n=1 Tax=Meripilus lineatus TaxID=2056292 RepID=A0AAD5YJL5_9APHY|nr:hypothetical protein NLI96_g2869 [Physisporinus lineatus]
MDPEIAEAVAQFAPPLVIDEISVSRKQFDLSLPAIQAKQRLHLPSESEYTVNDHRISVDGGDITIRTIIPSSKGQNPEERCPLLFWIHGGGWALGSIELDDLWLRRLSVDYKLTITNVDYRLEMGLSFKFSLQVVERVFMVPDQATENTTALCASLEKGFIVAGSSAGANLTAAVALRARDDPFFANKQLTGQLLQIPATIHPLAFDKYKSELLSLEQNKDAPILQKAVHMGMMELLQAPPTDPDFSVILNPNHSGLPPTYFQVCGLDPLRDEGLLYERLLRESDVETKLDLYPGLPHGGHNFFPQLSISTKFNADTLEGTAWLLKGSVDRTT